LRTMLDFICRGRFLTSKATSILLQIYFDKELFID